jgi:hypothetical protein
MLKEFAYTQRRLSASVATLLLLLLSGTQTYAQTGLTEEEGLAIVAPIYEFGDVGYPPRRQLTGWLPHFCRLLWQILPYCGRNP